MSKMISKQIFLSCWLLVKLHYRLARYFPVLTMKKRKIVYIGHLQRIVNRWYSGLVPLSSVQIQDQKPILLIFFLSKILLYTKIWPMKSVMWPILASLTGQFQHRVKFCAGISYRIRSRGQLHETKLSVWLLSTWGELTLSLKNMGKSFNLSSEKFCQVEFSS